MGVKHDALSLTIVSGVQNGRMISSWTESLTTPSVNFVVALPRDQLGRCSTHTSAKRFPGLDGGKEPAKSMDKVERRFVQGNDREVRYLWNRMAC